MIRIPEPKIRKSLIASIEAIVGESGYSLRNSDRLSYSRDASFRAAIDAHYSHFEAFPSAIVWPRTTIELSQIIKIAGKFRVPIVPYGGGSGVCGGAMPIPHGLTVDLKRMRRLLRVDERRLVAEAECGIYGLELEKQLQRRGYTLGHFPSSILVATLGGYLAARSAGQCSNKFGKIEDLVLDFEFVDGKGEIRRTADVSRGGGTDFTQAIVGSEGTLGIITRARFKIHRKPESRLFRSLHFPNLDYGIEALRRIAQSGIKPDILRLYDEIDTFLMTSPGKTATTLPSLSGMPDSLLTAARKIKQGAMWTAFRSHRLINTLGQISNAGCRLIVVIEGHPKLIARQMELLRGIAGGMGARDEGIDAAAHWYANRYGVAYKASKLFMEGAFTDTMEVAAPWSRLKELYRGVYDATKGMAIVMAHISHVYSDGAAIYFTFVAPLRGREKSLTDYDALWTKALTAVQKHGGVISHHHGIGRLKAPFIRSEWGDAGISYRKLKDFFDPHGLLNPGVLLPQQIREDAEPAA